MSYHNVRPKMPEVTLLPGMNGAKIFYRAARGGRPGLTLGGIPHRLGEKKNGEQAQAFYHIHCAVYITRTLRSFAPLQITSNLVARKPTH